MMERAELYATMLRIRMVEREIARLYPRQEMRSPTHLYIGQEAVAAGVCGALERDDVLLAYYRSHGWYLAKGGSLVGLMGEMYGRVTGCSGGWGGSMHLIDRAVGFMGTSAIVAGGISHAVGTALADRILGRATVSVAAFGDGAVEAGAFHESLNFAALRKLPVIFVCENNLWAAFTPLAERQPQPDVALRAAAYGMPGVTVDGNDVLSVQAATADAVARARAGEGPTLIECHTYRWLEHCGPNDDVAVGLRSAEDVAAWKARCPIARARHFVTEDEDERLHDRVRQEIEVATADARRAPWPVQTWRPAYYEV